MSDLLPILAAISAFSNRAAEAFKAALKAHYPALKPEVVSEIALLVSLAAGVVGAFVLNVNVLAVLPANPYLARVPAWVGIILTGCAASIGSEFLQWFFDLAQAKRDQMGATTTSSSVKVEAKTETVAPTEISSPERDLSKDINTAVDARLTKILKDNGQTGIG